MLYLMLVVVFSSLSKKWWFFLILGWGRLHGVGDECSYLDNIFILNRFSLQDLQSYLLLLATLMVHSEVAMQISIRK